MTRFIIEMEITGDNLHDPQTDVLWDIMEVSQWNQDDITTINEHQPKGESIRKESNKISDNIVDLVDP